MARNTTISVRKYSTSWLLAQNKYFLVYTDVNKQMGWNRQKPNVEELQVISVEALP